MHKRFKANTSLLVLFAAVIIIASCEKITEFEANTTPTRSTGGTINNGTCKLETLSTNDSSYSVSVFYSGDNVQIEMFVENMADTTTTTYTNDIISVHNNGLTETYTLDGLGYPIQMIRKLGLSAKDTINYVYEDGYLLEENSTKMKVVYTRNASNNIVSKRVTNNKYGVDTLLETYDYYTDQVNDVAKLQNYILRGPIVGKASANQLRKITRINSTFINGQFVAITTYVDLTYYRESGKLITVKTVTTSDKPLANTVYSISYSNCQ